MAPASRSLAIHHHPDADPGRDVCGSVVDEMTNVISLGETNILASHLTEKARDAKNGEIIGFILICQYSEEFEHNLTEDIVGMFPSEPRDRRNLTGALDEMKTEVNAIDTEIHEYD